MIFRPFNSDDARTFYRWYHDPRLAAYFRGFTHGASLQQCANAPDYMQAHILVGEDSDGQLLGAITFADRDRILRIYKMGLFVDPDQQHQGVGRELLELGLEWAFDRMNAHKVVAEFMARDGRIIKGAKEAGFTEEGVSRQSCFFNGVLHDEVIISILQSEYDRNGA